MRMFQSTRLREARQCITYLHLQMICFNPRAYVRRDSLSIQQALLKVWFQSTRLREARHVNVEKYLDYKMFQSTRLREARRSWWW